MAGTIRGSRNRPGNGAPVSAPFAAHLFRNREISASGGQSGRVVDVLIDDDGERQAVVDFGSELGQHRIPMGALEYERGRFLVREDVRELPSFTAEQKGWHALDAGAMLDIPGYRPTEDEDSTIRFESSAPQVKVQRPGLTINWEQAPPQVTVHQPTARVNVRQRQPTIIVRQPPPRITVELDQPEIIVRMADPDVDVAIAEPHVQVSIPKPQVEVVQAEQAHVKIHAGDPLVSLVPRQQAEVSIERGDAAVLFERVGQPQVFVREAEGPPRIRFEELPREARDAPLGERRDTKREARGEEQRAEMLRSSAARARLWTSRLEGSKIFGRDGEELGKIHRVLGGPGGEIAFVLAHHTVLGLGGQRALLPLDRFAMDGDKLTLRELGRADLDALDSWDEASGVYLPVGADRAIEIDFLR